MRPSSCFPPSEARKGTSQESSTSLFDEEPRRIALSLSAERASRFIFQSRLSEGRQSHMIVEYPPFRRNIVVSPIPLYNPNMSC
jgi:hypothetical protein